MAVNLGKFVHTETGKILMSILLGFGLASLFRKICKDRECLIFHAPSLDDFKDKIYKNDSGKCVKYNPIQSKCNMNAKIVDFE
jgi:thiosulfate reductase cytochrome b subunit